MRRCAAAVVLLAILASAVVAAEPPKPPAGETQVPYDSKTRGALRVKGDTKDWFLINQKGKRAGPGTPPLLNTRVELAPGTYEVVVNRTRRTVTVRAGKEAVLLTGTLVVEGKGANWYAPYRGKLRCVADAPPTLNAPIALFPGTYTVRASVGDRDVNLGEARVVAGRKTVLKK